MASPSLDPVTPNYIQPVDKSPPRPAPTLEYSWADYHPNAKIFYVRDHNEANLRLAHLAFSKARRALGFDLEWKPTYVKGGGENPVALVQLANENAIYLLQVSAMQEFPSNLALLLANPFIVKAGVAIQSDAKKIYTDYRVQMTNCVELSLLARTVDNARWQGKYNSSLGLARLIETYEYRLLGKGKITRSNWEAELNSRQIEYASNDAHAGYVLFRKLDAMKAALPAPPDPVWYSFNFIAGHVQDAAGAPWHPQNPNYDPGPPPPPRADKSPNARKARKAARAAAQANGLASPISSGSPPSPRTAPERANHSPTQAARPYAPRLPQHWQQQHEQQQEQAQAFWVADPPDASVGAGRAHPAHLYQRHRPRRGAPPPVVSMGFFVAPAAPSSPPSNERGRGRGRGRGHGQTSSRGRGQGEPRPAAG